MLTVGLVFFFFIVQTLSFMHCTCNFICGLSDVIIKTFSQSRFTYLRVQLEGSRHWRENEAISGGVLMCILLFATFVVWDVLGVVSRRYMRNNTSREVGSHVRKQPL